MQVPINSAKVQLDYCLALVRQKQFNEALTRYQYFLKHYPLKLPHALLGLHQELTNTQPSIHIQLIIAELYLNAQLYEDCFLECQTIYTDHPQFSPVYSLLNKLYKKTLNKDYIIPIFSDALHKDIFDSVVLDVLPTLYLENEDIDNSIVIFEKITNAQPDNENHPFILAELYKKKGLYDKAVQTIATLVERAPQLVSKACHFCEDIILRTPHNIDARKLLIQLYATSCNPDQCVFHIETICQLHLSFKTEAIQIYNTLLTHFPSDFHILCSFINHLISCEHYTDAIDHLAFFSSRFSDQDDFIASVLNQILDAQPLHPQATLTYIDLLLKQKNYTQAKTQIDALLTLDTCPLDLLLERINQALLQPTIEMAHFEYQYAYILFLKGHLDSAFDYCNRPAPFYLEKEKLKLTILIAQKKFSTSKKICLSLIEKYPYEKEYFDLLLQTDQHACHAQTQTETNAKKSLILALKQGQCLTAIDIAQSYSSTNDDSLLIQLIISRCFFEQGRIDQALNQLSHIQNSQINNNTLFCEILFFKATFHFFLNQFSKSIDCFEEILHFNIHHDKLHTIIAQIKKAPLTTLHGHCITGLINPLGNTLVLCGIQNLEELQPQPDNAIGFSLSNNNTGAAYLIKQNYLSADSAFSSAIQLDQDCALIHSNYSLCQLMNQDYDNALVSINKALALNPNNDIYHLNKGLILCQQGHTERALLSFKSAVKLNNHNYHALYNMAMMYYQLNRLCLCFQYLKKVDQSGLFFMFLQRQFYYLNTFSNSIFYWGTSSFDLLPSSLYKDN